MKEFNPEHIYDMGMTNEDMDELHEYYTSEEGATLDDRLRESDKLIESAKAMQEYVNDIIKNGKI